MNIMMFNGLFLFLLFMWTSAESGPEIELTGGLQDQEYEHDLRLDIQGRAMECKILDGKCIKNKRKCPDNRPLMSKPGSPYCSKGRRCCYPVPDTTPVPPTCPACPVVTDEPCPAPSKIQDSELKWSFVGRDYFVSFTQRTNWFGARDLCGLFGLNIYQPINVSAVAEYLADNFIFVASTSQGTSYHHLGGRGNGTHQIWLSGEVVGRDEPWYDDYYKYAATKDCLYLTASTWYHHANPGSYDSLDSSLKSFPDSCERRDPKYPLCGTIPSSDLVWHEIGEDRFVRYSHKMNWTDSRSFCKAHGLDLYKPKDFAAVSLYLDDNFDYGTYWLGARGNGEGMQWVSGGILSSDNPSWMSGEPGIVFDFYCLLFFAKREGKVLRTWGCMNPQYPLCGKTYAG